MKKETWFCVLAIFCQTANLRQATQVIFKKKSIKNLQNISPVG